MSSIARKYQFKGTDGKKYAMTDKQFYERILVDSKRDYNWIAYASEIVRVCSDRHFSKAYAVAIKRLIVNCFANWELKREFESTELPTDEAAVTFCYNSLSDDDKESAKVKDKYLKAVIEAVIKYEDDEPRMHFHVGATYQKLIENWKTEMFNCYRHEENLNFAELRKELNKDFDAMLKKAEEDGDLDEDDETFRKIMHEIVSEIT